MNYVKPLSVGFSIGAIYNAISNGLHIGCCHTYSTVAMGSVLRGFRTMIIYSLVTYGLDYLVTSVKNDKIMRILSKFLAANLTLYLLLRWEDYEFRKHMDDFWKENADLKLKLFPKNRANIKCK